ncbi:TadE/TadG family type IV pilus assembly protein [Vibrio chaetopteri]|uniref:TadE/TadG family type IV pilus assembly protein n=1 Tax=Vibrio chaetopteri TaxID=3016528 RepID=UPI003AB57E78
MSRRKQLATASIKRQKGVAGIWLGFTLVPIMGFTFWAVEGTRYVQEYNRLGDANEAAAMAMTIQDNPASAEQLAKDYLQSYVRDIDSMSVDFSRAFQEQDKDAGQDEFVQYSVDTVTSHKSWFTSTFIPSFGEQVSLGGKAVAKKYATYLGDNNIDIVFVADFSGSMRSSWKGSQNTKIKDLQLAISEVSAKILCENIGDDVVDGKDTKVCLDSNQADMADKLDNRIALAPFNTRTREVDGSYAYSVSQLRYKGNYESVDWDWWRTSSFREVYLCASNKEQCIGSSLSRQLEAATIKDVLNISRRWWWGYQYSGSNYPDVNAYIDYTETVTDMLSDKFPQYSTTYRVNDVNLYEGYGYESNSQFYNVPLTSSLTSINRINQMEADGATAAFQGILKGVQLLAEGNPHSSDQDEQDIYLSKVKMLLIFSDGQESPHPKILENLVASDMCNSARKLIPGLYIGFIGIDFDADLIDAFRQCVNNPEQDIIKVGNLNDLIAKIEELIKNGSKSNGFTKLY